MTLFRLPSLRTKRLELRAFRASDFRAWEAAHRAHRKKSGVHDLAPLDEKLLRREVLGRAIAKHRELGRADKVYMWNLFRRDTGEFIGWVDVAPLNRDPHQMANLGYALFPAQRGHGFAAEAVRAVIPIAFRTLGLNRLEASIDPGHRASIRVARAAGLEREGIKREYYFDRGRWRDQLVLMVTPRVWRGRKYGRRGPGFS